ncbi:DUF4442 domain-containing protein [Rubrolithibacter danxiaensis]|uniref:DUF4442 domain-containing protein n=1 Tax=Rubrolithibacter danxiaensis TaxID=3390805 RepID=UPI003BF833DF
MMISERILKWGMRFYPPLFFQRIWVQTIEKNFTGVRVKIIKSLFNINYNKSIFGGTIFSATDPFYPVCFYQILTKKGYKVLLWTKSSEINFIKPGNSSLYFSISITETEINEVCKELEESGKFIKSYSIEIVNSKKELCASVMNEVYIRKLL